MFNLIYNEMQKIFCKKSTYILLALLFLLTVGYQALVKISGSQESTYYKMTREDVENQKNLYETYYKEDQTDIDSKREYLTYSTMLDTEVYLSDVAAYYADEQDWTFDALYYLLSAYVYPMNQLQATFDEDWSLNMLEERAAWDEATVAAAEETSEALKEALKNKDWKEFYTILQEDMEVNATHWENSSEIAAYSAFVLSGTQSPDRSDWRVQTYMDKAGALSWLKSADAQIEAGLEVDETVYQAQQDLVAICTYRLENNQEYGVYKSVKNADPNSYSTEGTYIFSGEFFSVLDDSAGLIQVVTILVVVIGGAMIAAEFAEGTIKFLLINPVKRGKIFFSKYIALCISAVAMLVLLLLINVLTGMVLYGPSQITGQYLYVSGGAVKTVSAFVVVLESYGWGCVELLMTGTLAITLSSLLRSAAVAIGVSLGVLFVGSTAVTILSLFGQDWARYLYFANTDLADIAQGNAIFPHQTLSFALVVLVIHLVVFLLTAYDGFTRRSV